MHIAVLKMLICAYGTSHTVCAGLHDRINCPHLCMTQLKRKNFNLWPSEHIVYPPTFPWFQIHSQYRRGKEDWNRSWLDFNSRITQSPERFKNDLWNMLSVSMELTYIQYIQQESMLLHGLSTLIQLMKWKKKVDQIMFTLHRSAPRLILGYDLQVVKLINVNLKKLPDHWNERVKYQNTGRRKKRKK